MSPMTLRSEIEALLVEFDHFAYRGAPLDVAVEKLQEILARTAPRVLTTMEELDSEEAAAALCLYPVDDTGIVALSERKDGKNEWSSIGTDLTCSSDMLISWMVERCTEPAFTLIEKPEATR
jgi:hypothetical protein